MSESVLDFAALDTAATEPVVTETTEVTVPDTSTETTEVTSDKTESAENAETTTGEVAKEKAEDLPGTEATPQNIRQALKQLRDANPANAAVVKELHGSFERWQASKAIFPKGVAEMKEAKAFIDTVGGHEGWEKAQELISNINQSDELLYAGDPKLIENIVADLKGEGKLDALGKMAPAFFEALKSNDQDGYYAAFAPQFLAGLEEVELPQVMQGVTAALTKGGEAGIAEAKKLIEGMTKWYDGLKAKAEKSKADAVSPERLKLDEDRKAFQKQQEEFKTNQTKQFQENVGKETESLNNRILGNDLKAYLKMPFFKEFSRENLMPLGNTIKQELYSTLKSDKAYQAQMKALWGAKDPDRAKIVEYHKAKLESISYDTVKNVVQRMYPGYAKNGPAAGRVAAAEAKKATEQKANATAVATGKPQYVAVKPTWEEIAHEKDPQDFLYIAGKAYLKNGKFVTWRK